MKAHEYTLHLQMIIQQARLIHMIDIAGVLNAMERVDTVGPIIDPTLWMKGHKNMDVQREIAQAALTFQIKIAAIVEKHGLVHDSQA